jgi:hypothetical protein|tara:strand:+ start:232 stop:1095 length:864 start_codon:yes stop_codon:yes gene_type:complete
MDGKIPNLALMRLANHYHNRGDQVEWWLGPLFNYDKVFASKIFEFTPDDLPDYVKRGGTGFAWDSKLDDDVDPGHSGGWFMYPKYSNHIGFSERGCRLNCSFCVVPQKEGKPKFESSIGDLLTNPRGEDRLVLLDDDFLGHPNVIDVLNELIGRKLEVNFIQGLNIRLITEEQANLLAQVRFRSNSFKNKSVSFAWDRAKDARIVKKGFERCLEAGLKPYQMQFYILVGYDSTPEEDLERVETLRALGADPYVMAYDRTVKYQRRFQRWVNHRAIFNSVSWKEYARA